MNTNQKSRTAHLAVRGFTIVELLIVIVVIAILAAITIVTFSGMRSRVIDSSMQSDLQSAAKLLANDLTLNSVYPLTPAAASNGRGLPLSNGSAYNYTVSNTSTPPTYNLSISNTGSANSFTISNTNATPKLVVGTYDNFNRSDSSTLGVASGGQTWTILSGPHWYISGNKVAAGNGSGSVFNAATLPTGLSDGTVSVDCTVSVSMDQGLALRAQDDNNYIFVDLTGDGAGNYVTRTFRKTNATFSPITSLTTVPGLSPGITVNLKAVMLGTTITIYVNSGSGDLQVGQSTSSTGLESQTAQGMVVNGGQINNIFDNFTVSQ